MDADGMTSVDLLEENRAALDRLEPFLLGRTIDIEMPRLRLLTDPMLFRRVGAELIGYAGAHSELPDSILVPVGRTEKAARIDVVTAGRHLAGDDFPGLAAAAKNWALWAARSEPVERSTTWSAG